jgi:hypothetical protein
MWRNTAGTCHRIVNGQLNNKSVISDVNKCTTLLSLPILETHCYPSNKKMFYSQVILSRKGPLGKIWLAAHFEKRLSKSQIFATDITQSVDNVLNPSAPLALRVSGHLMLGIVRIYSKKVIKCYETAR